MSNVEIWIVALWVWTVGIYFFETQWRLWNNLPWAAQLIVSQRSTYSTTWEQTCFIPEYSHSCFPLFVPWRRKTDVGLGKAKYNTCWTNAVFGLSPEKHILVQTNSGNQERAQSKLSQLYNFYWYMNRCRREEHHWRLKTVWPDGNLIQLFNPIKPPTVPP